MNDQQSILTKKQDDLLALKGKLQSFQKKEGSNFLTRDFTDEIYDPKNAIEKSVFISSAGSTMFTDVLVVIPGGKSANFANEMMKVMPSFYEKQDFDERKRFPDQGKIKNSEMKETSDEQAKEDFVKDVLRHAQEKMNKKPEEMKKLEDEPFMADFIEVVKDIVSRKMEVEL